MKGKGVLQVLSLPCGHESTEASSKTIVSRHLLIASPQKKEDQIQANSYRFIT